MSKTKAHPGFQAVAQKIATKEGVSIKTADKMLASSTRNASKAAHNANHHLSRVRGK